jgi:hypothetical protein
MSWTIRLDRQSLSENALAYSHWRVRTRDRDAWLFLLRSFLATNPIPKASGRRCVSFMAYRKRTLDDDNLSGGLKGMRDCLTRTGLITNDNKAGAIFTYNQGLCRVSPTGAPCLLIELSDITEP